MAYQLTTKGLIVVMVDTNPGLPRKHLEYRTLEQSVTAKLGEIRLLLSYLLATKVVVEKDGRIYPCD